MEIKTGTKISRWTVLGLGKPQSFRRGKNNPKMEARPSWNCQCDCGTIRDVLHSRLVSGRSASCGCFQREIATKHGLSTKPFYHRWEGIIRRCNHPKYEHYNLYGGRGIKCLWKSFEDFKNDMYESYLKHCEEFGEKNTTLDRVNSNGNYCKENCRWFNRIQQQNNMRSNKLLEYKGQIKTMKMWSRELGFDYHLIAKRLNPTNIKKWTVQEAFETPKLRNR
jgi:hypothetical protein